MIIEKIDYQGLFEWDEHTIVALEGSGIELKKGDLVGFGFDKNDCRVFPFAAIKDNIILFYTEYQYENHDGFEQTSTRVSQVNTDKYSVFVNNPPINIDLEETMEDFKKECRTKLNKQKRKNGYYWVSDVKEPTKDDWYVVEWMDDEWYFTGVEPSVSDNRFTHINENRLEYGN